MATTATPARGASSTLLAGGAWGPSLQQLLLAEDHGVDVVGGELNAVAVGDRVGGAGFDAITAEDTARVVDVVGLGVTFASGNALRFGIFGCLNEDAVRRTGRGAEEASDTLLQPIFVALQDVDSAIARLHAGGDLGKVFRGRLAEHSPQCDAEPFHQSRESFSNFTDD